jgi:hypothetical protein
LFQARVFLPASFFERQFADYCPPETALLLMEISLTTSDTLASFPARMKYSNFLLVRSEDKNRILLLGFETIADSLPTLHSFLYDKNWTLLNKTIHTNANISQPYVQYDLVDYPLEHFSNTADQTCQ